ncbi:MAG: response regulator [Bacteroidota bacterium]
MDHQIYILIVEDELEVMDAIVNDLAAFEDQFPIETANSSEEAKQVITSIYESEQEVGLILCDHILPGENGVELLIELSTLTHTQNSKKVLVTGQAGLEDTVKAVNQADLNHYISKPWTKEQLSDVVTEQLTDYVIEHKANLLPFMARLDGTRLSEAMRNRPLTDH